MRANGFVAFEGHAHPYKQNLLKYPGQTVKSLLEVPGVEHGVNGPRKSPLGVEGVKDQVEKMVEAR